MKSITVSKTVTSPDGNSIHTSVSAEYDEKQAGDLSPLVNAIREILRVIENRPTFTPIRGPKVNLPEHPYARKYYVRELKELIAGLHDDSPIWLKV